MSKGVFSILVALSLAIAAPALASPLVATQGVDGEVTAIQADELTAQKLGSLLLPKGQVSINGNTISVYTVPDWLFDEHLVLSGIVIGSQLDNSAVPVNPSSSPNASDQDSKTLSQSNLSGTAYFIKGEWLPNLGSTLAVDTITTKDGKLWRGNVIGSTEKSLELQLSGEGRQTIAIDQIKAVSSIRAFRYTIQGAGVRLQPTNNQIELNAGAIAFSANTLAGRAAAVRAKQPPSRLAGTEGGVRNSTIVAQATLDILQDISPAILAPLIYKTPTASIRTLRLYEELGAQGIPLPSNNPIIRAAIGESPISPLKWPYIP